MGNRKRGPEVGVPWESFLLPGIRDKSEKDSRRGTSVTRPIEGIDGRAGGRHESEKKKHGGGEDSLQATNRLLDTDVKSPNYDCDIRR